MSIETIRTTIALPLWCEASSSSFSRKHTSSNAADSVAEPRAVSRGTRELVDKMAPTSWQFLDNFVCKYDEVEREVINVEPFVIESHASLSVDNCHRCALSGHGHGHGHGHGQPEFEDRP